VPVFWQVVTVFKSVVTCIHDRFFKNCTPSTTLRFMRDSAADSRGSLKKLMLAYY